MPAVVLCILLGAQVGRHQSCEGPEAAEGNGPPTLPYEPDEVAALIAACEQLNKPNPREIPRARIRARAAVLLMLYSGLRISDS